MRLVAFSCRRRHLFTNRHFFAFCKIADPCRKCLPPSFALLDPTLWNFAFISYTVQTHPCFTPREFKGGAVFHHHQSPCRQWAPPSPEVNRRTSPQRHTHSTRSPAEIISWLFRSRPLDRLERGVPFEIWNGPEHQDRD
jgi:hypothetical protein